MLIWIISYQDSFSENSKEVGHWNKIKFKEKSSVCIKSCLKFPAKADDKYLDFILPQGWHERCPFIPQRSEIKWRVRKGGANLQIPKYKPQKQIDIKYLPDNFMFLIKLLSSKCEYCDKFRLSPKHLLTNHSIRVEPFTIESVYADWKKAKKMWKSLSRDSIISRGKIIIQGYINNLAPHTVNYK